MGCKQDAFFSVSLEPATHFTVGGLCHSSDACPLRGLSLAPAELIEESWIKEESPRGRREGATGVVAKSWKFR